MQVASAIGWITGDQVSVLQTKTRPYSSIVARNASRGAHVAMVPGTANVADFFWSNRFQSSTRQIRVLLSPADAAKYLPSPDQATLVIHVPRRAEITRSCSPFSLQSSTLPICVGTASKLPSGDHAILLTSPRLVDRSLYISFGAEDSAAACFNWVLIFVPATRILPVHKLGRKNGIVPL